MKFAFVDAEFTGEHAYTTLVSLGIVGMGEESLSVSFNDFSRDQVTPWLRENVLVHIDETESMSRAEAFPLVARWFEQYAAGERVSLVSSGKSFDLILLFELWHFGQPERPYFHHRYGLPPCLNHSWHFDLETILLLAGVDPDSDREELVDHCVPGSRHESLHDAMVVRECFRRFATGSSFPGLRRSEGVVRGAEQREAVRAADGHGAMRQG